MGEPVATASPAPVRVGAVVVTHESDAVLEGLLATLERHEPDVPVVVVDSGSPGGPPSPAGVALLALSENVGFGAACNRGVERLRRSIAGLEVVACLNPDVRLTGPTLTQLAGELRRRPGTGVATGPVVDEHGDRVSSAWGPTSVARAVVFGTGWDLRGPRRLVARVAPRRRGANTSGASLVTEDLLVDGHVLGGAMVVSLDCWDAIGGFDDGYFLYWEDADLCHRARAAGFDVRVLPVEPFVHEQGTSSAGVLPEQRWQWYLEGAERFAGRHLSPAAGRRLLRSLRLGRLLSRRR